MKKNGKWMKVIVIIVLAIVLASVILVLFYRSRQTELVPPQVQHRPAQLQIQEPKEEDSDMTEKQQPYVENQVLAIADSKREAKKIAKEVGGELISYDNQVAVIQIGITVEEMMNMLEENPSLPKVYPNYQNYTN